MMPILSPCAPLLRVCVFSILCCGMLLGGCSTKGGTIRDKIGLTSKGPDEMSVVKRSTLQKPTSATLPNPRLGAASLVDPQPEQMVQKALFGRVIHPTTATTPSPGELALLSLARTEQADPAVRDEMVAEEAAKGKDKRLLDGVLLDPEAEIDMLDADAEAVRLGVKYPSKTSSNLQ